MTENWLELVSSIGLFPDQDDRKLRWIKAVARYRDETAAAVEGLLCIWCGLAAETFDHVIPRALGGSDEPDNLLPTCRSCNASKRASSPQEWVRRTEATARLILDGSAPFSGSAMRRWSWRHEDLIPALRELEAVLCEILRETES